MARRRRNPAGDIFLAVMGGAAFVFFAIVAFTAWIQQTTGIPPWLTLPVVIGSAIYGIVALIRMRHRHALANHRAIDISQIDTMDGTQFEHYLIGLLQSQGYQAQHNGQKGDLGVDIIAARGGDKFAIQVKRHSKVDIHTGGESAFEFACANGRLHIAKRLLSLEKTHGKIAVHGRSECAFRRACGCGQNRILDFLLSLEPTHGRFDIHAAEDEAFWNSLDNRHLAIAAKIISLQHTHGKIAPAIVELWAPKIRMTTTTKIEKALKNHTYPEAHTCLAQATSATNETLAQIARRLTQVTSMSYVYTYDKEGFIEQWAHKAQAALSVHIQFRTKHQKNNPDWKEFAHAAEEEIDKILTLTGKENGVSHTFTRKGNPESNFLEQNYNPIIQAIIDVHIDDIDSLIRELLNLEKVFDELQSHKDHAPKDIRTLSV